MKLSDSISRKFVDSVDINDYEILTDEGWADIKAVHKTVPYDIWVLKTSSFQLQCADTHIVFDQDMNEVFVKDLHIGDGIYTENGIEQVTEVYCTNSEPVNMFDVELADENSNHRYYTDGILSHNTTSYTIFCLWYATYFKDKKIMICSNKLQTSTEIIGRIQRAYEYLPSFLKSAVKTYNKTEIEFTNGSVIKGFATGSSASRGFSGNCVIIDEMAFIPKNIMSDFFASVMPVISSGKNSKAIVVSTPNGVDNLYYELWQAANAKGAKNKEGWKPFRIDWWEAGGIRDEKWKQKQIETVGIDRWRQEFGNEFLSAGLQKLIPDDIIERYRMKISEYKERGINQGKDLFVTSEDGTKTYTFTMYHAFDKTRTYIASGDIGEGIGGDSSILYIWDITNTGNIKMCLKFESNRIPIIEFAFACRRILQMYCDPVLAIESNGIGVSFIEQMRYVYAYENMVRLNRDNGCGIQSHVQIKGRACLWLQEMMTTEGFGFEIYDKALVDEFSTFVKKDADRSIIFKAIGTNHDDHILSLVWMAYILHESNIDRYFIVTDYFTTSLEKTLPRRISPMEEYTQRQITDVVRDPIYRQFKFYEEEIKKEYDEYMQKTGNDYDEFKHLIDINGMSDRQAVEFRRNQIADREPIGFIGGGVNYNNVPGYYSGGYDQSGYYDSWGGNSW